MTDQIDNRSDEQKEFDEWVDEQRFRRKQKIEKINSEATTVFLVVGFGVFLVTEGGTASVLASVLVGVVASIWFKSREMDKLGTGP